MNDILKLELEKHFNKCNSREKFVEKELQKLDFDKSDFEERIEIKLSNVAIKLLRAKNFQFGDLGTRFYDRCLARIKPSENGNRIETRDYKHRYWNDISFLGRYNSGSKMYEVLPDGFREAIDIVKDKMGDIDSVEIKFNKKINTSIPISFIYSDEKIKNSRVISINVDESEIDMKLTNDDYFSENKQAYAYDEIFTIIRGLLKDRKKGLQEIYDNYNQKCNEIEEFIDTKFDIILVKTRLMQDI